MVSEDPEEDTSQVHAVTAAVRAGPVRLAAGPQHSACRRGYQTDHQQYYGSEERVLIILQASQLVVG
jgi:hypothetical protein